MKEIGETFNRPTLINTFVVKKKLAIHVIVIRIYIADQNFTQRTRPIVLIASEKSKLVVPGASLDKS